MKIQKKIAMTFGGAVLAACLTVGGLAAANASTPASSHATATPPASPRPAAPTAVTATAAATVPVPVMPSSYFHRPFDEWVATLTPAQQQALLADREAKLAHYKEIGFAPAVEKLTYDVDVIKKALDQ
jgi:hypothetical protein